MRETKVSLRNPANGKVKSIKWGISWVYLIFGGWALLFQGRWLYIGIELVMDILAPATAGTLFFIYHLFLFLMGNKMYARYLLSKGWEPLGEQDARIMGV